MTEGAPAIASFDPAASGHNGDINPLRNAFLMIVSVLFISFPCYGETVVPIEIRFGSIFVSADMDGKEVRLGVDTGGAGSLRLKSDVVQSLGLDTTPSNNVTTNAHGIEKETRDLIVPVLELGGTQFTEIPAFTEPSKGRVLGDPPGWWPKSAGTIGREFLRRFLVVVDYQRGRISLYDYNETKDAPCAGPEISLIDHSEGIYASDVRVDDGSYTAIWDTGASHSFVKESVANEKSLPLSVDEEGTAWYSTKKFAFGDSQLGPMAFVVQPFVEPKGIDLYIGGNFFASHLVCLNARDGWVRVTGSR